MVQILLEHLFYSVNENISIKYKGYLLTSPHGALALLDWCRIPNKWLLSPVSLSILVCSGDTPRKRSITNILTFFIHTIIHDHSHSSHSNINRFNSFSIWNTMWIKTTIVCWRWILYRNYDIREIIHIYLRVLEHK